MHSHPLSPDGQYDIAGTCLPSDPDIQTYRRLRDELGLQEAWITNGIDSARYVADEFRRPVGWIGTLRRGMRSSGRFAGGGSILMTSHLAAQAGRTEAYLARLGVADAGLAPTPDALGAGTSPTSDRAVREPRIHAGESIGSIRAAPGQDRGPPPGGFCYELNGLRRAAGGVGFA